MYIHIYGVLWGGVHLGVLGRSQHREEVGNFQRDVGSADLGANDLASDLCWRFDLV